MIFMMWKAYGYGFFGLAVMVLFTFGTDLTPVMAFRSVVLVAALGFGFWFLFAPEQKPVQRPVEWPTLIAELEDLAAIARRDGLLAIESVRKGLRDPNLQIWVKWVGDGYDQHVVGRLIQNQMKQELDLHQSLLEWIAKSAVIFPAAGLMGSLVWMMNSPIVVSAMIFSVAVGLILQFIVQLLFETKAIDHRFKTILYFDCVHEGILGMIQGTHSDILKASLLNRIGKV
jgi:flagellar motor component MotA